MGNKHQRLYNQFDSETQLTAKLKTGLVEERDNTAELEIKLAALEQKCSLKDENETEIEAKKFEVENRKLQETLQNKCLDINKQNMIMKVCRKKRIVCLWP